MKGRRWVVVTAVAVALSASGAAQAALYDRGGGLIYDDVLGITWLADANYAATQWVTSGGMQGDADGLMTWSAAVAWADGLSYYDSVRNTTWSNWRLPSTQEQCFGYNCTTSEMGYMFYINLGADQEQSVLNTTGDTAEEIDNLLLFGGSVGSDGVVTGSSIQSYVYWSGTEFAPDTSHAWYFYSGFGYQFHVGKDDYGFYAWAVRPGDVPLPGAGPLFLSALAGLGWARRGR